MDLEAEQAMDLDQEPAAHTASPSLAPGAFAAGGCCSQLGCLGCDAGTMDRDTDEEEAAAASVEALRTILASGDDGARMTALYEDGLREEQALLDKLDSQPEEQMEYRDGLDVDAVLAELREGTVLTAMLLERFVAEPPMAGMPEFAAVPVCCDRDCLRKLWLGMAHDKCTMEQVSRVWEIYAESNAPDEAVASTEVNPREEPPAKKSRVEEGMKQLGGYHRNAATKPQPSQPSQPSQPLQAFLADVVNETTAHAQRRSGLFDRQPHLLRRFAVVTTQPRIHAA